MEKFKQLIKVWWMLTWRLGSIVLIWDFKSEEPIAVNVLHVILVAFFIAGFIVVVKGKSIETFPLAKLFHHKPVVVKIFYSFKPSQRRRKANSRDIKRQWKAALKSKPQGKSNRRRKYEVVPRPPAPDRDSMYLPYATEDGHPSPFSSDILDALPTLSAYDFPQMTGRPGETPKPKTARPKTAKPWQSSVENFAKTLSLTGIINKHATVWSVCMPSPTDISDPDAFDLLLDSYIDCVLFTSKNIYLLDIKQYASGAMTYHSSASSLYAVDDATRNYVDICAKDNPKSENMYRIRRAFRELYPRYGIESYTVFMPTERGVATLNDVKTSGQIPAINLDDLLSIIKKERPFKTSKGGTGRAHKVVVSEHKK